MTQSAAIFWAVILHAILFGVQMVYGMLWDFGVFTRVGG